MTEQTSIAHLIGYAATFGYGLAAALFIWLQELLKKSQVDIPDKYLLIVAVGLALFGGAASYTLQVQQKKEESWIWPHLWQHMILSGFVALLIGLGSSGYLTDEWWLGLVLLSAFYKNVYLAVIPKALEQKLNTGLNVKVEDNSTNTSIKVINQTEDSRDGKPNAPKKKTMDD